MVDFYRKLCGNRCVSYSPKFSISSSILSNVGKIDASREIIDSAPLVPAWERRFRSDAIARIVHHGTHLEGNELNLPEVEQILDGQTKVTGRDRDIQEVINYRAVMDYIDSLEKKDLPVTEAMFQEIHRLTVAKILSSEESGEYRRVKVVIRNTTTGEITFRPPGPLEVPKLMEELFVWLNSEEGRRVHPILRAGVLHYELVRIHPFTDGNGRAARAMALLLLFVEGYKIKKFFSLEEYYDAHPSEYYTALKSVPESSGDMTEWLEYFVLGIAIEFVRVKELVQKLSLDLRLKKSLGGKQIALSDRQIKLIEFVERYGKLTMSDGRELLPEVSEDTILRDLRDLCDKKLIVKKGKTKGARYELLK